MTLTLRQIPSPNYGGARGQILWIIVHTAEGALTVDSLGSYFANTASGVSSHVGIDDHEIVQYVPYTGQAWTARSANPYADQAELCAFAAWTRAEWLKHPAMLANTARWIADRCKARGIPAVKIGPADVAARKPGVIGHVDITNGLHDGTHTDPGTSFPWDVVMAQANAILTGANMDLTPQNLTDIAAAVVNRQIDNTTPLWIVLRDLHRQLPVLAAAVAKIPTTGAQVDPKALAADIVAALPADLAKQLADELAKRLAA